MLVEQMSLHVVIKYFFVFSHVDDSTTYKQSKRFDG